MRVRVGVRLRVRVRVRVRLRLRVRVGVTWYERLAYALKDIGSVHLLSEMKNHEMGTWRGWGGQGMGKFGAIFNTILSISKPFII